MPATTSQKLSEGVNGRISRACKKRKENGDPLFLTSTSRREHGSGDELSSEPSFVRIERVTGSEDHDAINVTAGQSMSHSFMAKVLQNQKLMMGNQQRILRKINEFSAKFKNLESQNYFVNPIEYELLSDIHNRPIDSLEALKTFENNLRDPETKMLLSRKYSFVCKSGSGGNCAFILVDLLFCRKFLTKCSWTGVSRGDDGMKIAFQTFRNTVNFFFEIVHTCDNTFTLVDCHDFFKKILKNSTQRSESKLIRRSTYRKKRSVHKPSQESITEYTNNELVEMLTSAQENEECNESQNVARN